MSARQLTVCELKARVQMNIDRGIVGDESDSDALAAKLAECRTEEEIGSFLRMSRRWEYATRPLQDWLDWEIELHATRN